METGRRQCYLSPISHGPSRFYLGHSNRNCILCLFGNHRPLSQQTARPARALRFTSRKNVCRSCRNVQLTSTVIFTRTFTLSRPGAQLQKINIFFLLSELQRSLRFWHFSDELADFIPKNARFAHHRGVRML